MNEMKTRERKSPQVLVCQHGARHRYAVPRMLEADDMLTALYTDSSALSMLGACAAFFGKYAPAALKRLANRKINGVPRQKIFSSDAYNAYEFGQKLLGVSKQGYTLYRQRDRILSRRMIKWGLQGSNLLYTMYYDNLDFVRWAKSQGVRVAVDVYINPQTSEVMKEESLLFPGWGRRLDESIIHQEDEMWRQVAELADLLLCPSEWVAEGVRNLTPAAADKIRIVPYGCSIDFQGRTNTPVKGRVLFAGGDSLRKGLHYLAQAATKLKCEFPQLDVRIAGAIPNHIVNHPVCKDLNFIGKQTTEQMKEEFLSADCFVLPSLSEGFAGVVAEAIGAGCPVIVTKEAGSPIEHGREGLIVSSRNPPALTLAIQQMLTDRAFRNQCSVECLRNASYYTETKWRDRLVAALEEVMSDEIIDESSSALEMQ